ncbi:hypothetical protein FIBSPDRAFT_900780 [Athelia psychrophila]|uniref:Uncharacterized protein n=1 Tax=Athelia psychrophila TaxID=1759441 RepID=A0A165XZY1_9AGAM|nr:hypothetical protein FIBSPDRAFT_900780 [Fibularhizoctonia sp. CBS 109695]
MHGQPLLNPPGSWAKCPNTWRLSAKVDMICSGQPFFQGYFEEFPDDSASETESESDVPLGLAEEEVFAKTAVGKCKKKKAESVARKRARKTRNLSRNAKIQGRFIRETQEEKGIPSFAILKLGQPTTNNKSHRAPQETEGHIDLFYESRITPHVKQCAVDEDHKGPKINLIRQVARNIYEDESEETRAVVRAHLAAQTEERDMATKALAEVEGALQPTPKQYQEASNIFPSYIDGILREATQYFLCHIYPLKAADIRDAQALNAVPPGSGQSSLQAEGLEIMDFDQGPDMPANAATKSSASPEKALPIFMHLAPPPPGTPAMSAVSVTSAMPAISATPITPHPTVPAPHPMPAVANPSPQFSHITKNRSVLADEASTDEVVVEAAAKAFAAETAAPELSATVMAPQAIARGTTTVITTALHPTGSTLAAPVVVALEDNIVIESGRPRRTIVLTCAAAELEREKVEKAAAKMAASAKKAQCASSTSKPGMKGAVKGGCG